jgi:hypothetical protein
MGILDDAIKEHLELKRQHGAGDSELKQLEDEAFGPPERPGAEEAAPDPFAEAPTEFMAQPEAAEETPERRRAPDIAELQEAPEPAAEEESPAMEHEAIPEHEPAPEPEETEAGPSTEERHAIAEEPTQLYDVEGEFAASELRAPSEEELVEEEIGEPRLVPVDPLAGTVEEDEEEDDDEEDDDFFDEQRLSDELDQALEAPGELEPEEEDFEPEEEDLEPEEEPASTRSDEGGEPASTRSDEDLLEETPDFLEEAPEDDRLWFEQKPPKDFDFDD